jgi:hypothetical protein
VKGLDAKLKSNTKALEEAPTRLAASEAKHKEEFSTAKHTVSQAIEEARAATAEDALAKIVRRQSKREEMVAECINALSTSFGSKCFLPLRLYFPFCMNLCRPLYFMMQENRLGKFSSCMKTKLKILYLMPLGC